MDFKLSTTYYLGTMGICRPPKFVPSYQADYPKRAKAARGVVVVVVVDGGSVGVMHVCTKTLLTFLSLDQSIRVRP